MKMIVLTSYDGVSFEVQETVALKSQTLAYILEEDDVEKIDIFYINGDILEKVIEYCKKHVVLEGDLSSPSKEELKKWDPEFIKREKLNFHQLLMASYDLEIKSLHYLICQGVADLIETNTRDKIRASSKFIKYEKKSKQVYVNFNYALIGFGILWILS